jgi:hypothetical protein
VLGLEVVQQSPMALFMRLGGDHVYTAVETPRPSGDMPLLYHNGVDVASDEDVLESYDWLLAAKDEYGIKNIIN